MRIALKIAYDGRPFHGYARQPTVRTVEGNIIATLIKKNYLSDPKQDIFRSSSRTDKGVSALANVIAFNTMKYTSNIINECNTDFDHIIIYGFKQVDDSFYPRHAKQRIYQYYLPKDIINRQLLSSTVQLFIGTHDFSNFARIEPHKDPVRCINDIRITDSNNFYIIEFQAQTYLWHQIRRIISAVLKIGKDKISEDDIIQALDHPKQTIDFGLAPADRLILTDVLYDFSFETNIEAVKRRDDLKQHIIHRF